MSQFIRFGNTRLRVNSLAESIIARQLPLNGWQVYDSAMLASCSSWSRFMQACMQASRSPFNVLVRSKLIFVRWSDTLLSLKLYVLIFSDRDPVPTCRHHSTWISFTISRHATTRYTNKLAFNAHLALALQHHTQSKLAAPSQTGARSAQLQHDAREHRHPQH